MTEDGNIDSRDMSLSKLQKIVKGREAWSAAVHGVTKCQEGFTCHCTTKHITCIVRFISIMVTAAPPQIIRH